MAERLFDPAALAALTPEQRIAYSRIAGAQAAGRGISSLVRGAIGGLTGVDLRTEEERKEAAKREIAKRLRGVDTSDPLQVYPVVLRTLSEFGLTADAMAVAKEYQTLRVQAAELSRKERKDAEDAAIRRLKADVDSPDSALGKSVQRLLELYKQRDELPENSPQRQQLDRAISVMEGALVRTSGGSIKAVRTGDAVRILDNQGNEITKYPLPKTEGGRRYLLEGVYTTKGEPVYQDSRGNLVDALGRPLRSEDTTTKVPEHKMPTTTKEAISMIDAKVGTIQRAYELMTDPRVERMLGMQVALNRVFGLYDRFENLGRELRAKLAGLAVSEMNRLVGAAITEQEMARIAPYIPDPEKSPASVAASLRNMYKELTAIANEKRRINNVIPRVYPELPRLPFEPQDAPGAPGAPSASAPAAPTKPDRVPHPDMKGSGTREDPYRPLRREHADSIPIGAYYVLPSKPGQVYRRQK